MALMAVNFLLEKVSLLLSDDKDGKVIAEAREEFQDLCNQVSSLYDFVMDDDDDVAKPLKLEKEILSIVYKTEDVIDKFLGQEKEKMGKVVGIKCLDLNHMNRIHGLCKKINNIIEKMEQLTQNRQAPPPPRTNAKRLLMENFLREMKCGTGSSTQKVPQPHLLKIQDPEYAADEEVVGLDEEAETVISRLLNGSADPEIIPIVGMAGLGKTTLARTIFNDQRVSYEFFFVFRIDVGQTSDPKKILLKILTYLTKSLQEYQKKKVHELVEEIKKFMAKVGRCLIILDNVWDTDIFQLLTVVFPENRRGDRIIFTTRDEGIARFVNASPHFLKFLNDDETFQLLEKRVFGREGFPNELLQVGKSIASKCYGVPLAVVVIAEALRCSTKISDWRKVEKNVEQYLMNKDNPSSFLNRVNMSVNQLPEELQACFLYFGAFPRDSDIPAWKVIYLWIVEGLIKPNMSQTLEETAKNYLNELVSRNLVVAIQKTCDGNVKTCRVHNILHHFCKEVASCKWLFQQVCRNADQTMVTVQDPVISRRLCIQFPDLYDFLHTEPIAEHVRSFYCFSSERRQRDFPPPPIKFFCKAFPLIRVLDIESVTFLFSKDFFRLIHLRYIAISGDFKDLPESYGKFLNLQTLILKSSTSESILEIKANIWNMLRLRHLHTNVPAKLPPPPTPTGKSSCLQTLSVVSPGSCSKDVLAKACNLRKLSIQGRMTDFFESCNGGYRNLEELKCLERLKLLNDNHYGAKSLHGIPPSFIKFLRILKKLTLSNTRFDWSEAEKLGQLECLEILKLKENAFSGDSWRPAIGGFSQLQVLWMERAELKSWEASKDHFPTLRNLFVLCCENLEAVPFGLADIPSLHEMKLVQTYKAVKSAREIENKKRELGICKFKLTIFPPEAIQPLKGEIRS